MLKLEHNFPKIYENQLNNNNSHVTQT